MHAVVNCLAPGTVPVFPTDELRAYFDALTAHFGHWHRPPSARKDHWQVDEQLHYGQLVKRRERLLGSDNSSAVVFTSSRPAVVMV